MAGGWQETRQPTTRTAGNRPGLKDAYNLSQGRSAGPFMILINTSVPTGRGVDVSSMCYFYELFICINDLKQFSLNHIGTCVFFLWSEVFVNH